MIFYYSATGNTKYAANFLAERLGTGTVDILKCGDTGSLRSLAEGSVGIMFPIYCWGVPPVMDAFIGSLFPLVAKDQYVWAVCTCGDEAGVAMRKLDRKIRKIRGKGLDAIFSLVMPNTYVLLPGFDVDSKEVELRKLREAPVRLSHISRLIESGAEGVYDVVEGSLPRLRSMIFPLFEKWGVSPKKWHCTQECTGCSSCARVCPAENIVMREGRPEWGRRCFSCCACFHVCPVHAVEYGRFTKNKNQYKP